MSAPIETLAAQLSRNEYNYNNILRGLVEWDMNKGESTTIRLMTDSSPYFVDYELPTKDSISNYLDNRSSIDITTALVDDMLLRHESIYMKDDDVKIMIVVDGSTSYKLRLEVEYITGSIEETLVDELSPTNEQTFTFRLKNNARGFKIYASTPITVATKISIVTRLIERTVSTPYYRSVGVYSDVNFVQFPTNKNPIWNSSNSSPSVMILSHLHPETNTINFINYTGPDRDNGLRIYLPKKDMGITPKDGFTYEFNIRIAPNSQLGSSDELIRRQVGIYSVNSSSDTNSAKPLLLMSKSRMTNFYVWAENITVPDKEVYYYVKLVYSSVTKDWELLSFNQLDDHVFFSQVGFVDPIELQTNPSYPYYKATETSDVPTFSSPFVNMAMTSQSLTEVVRNPFN